MFKTILYIDGENLKHYIKAVLKQSGVAKTKLNLENFDYSSLFNQVLKGIKIFEKRFYSAKISFHKGSPEQSNKLILKQSIQKSNHEKRRYPRLHCNPLFHGLRDVEMVLAD
jgi:hypothetical protein